jgi:hypothetical protein
LPPARPDARLGAAVAHEPHLPRVLDSYLRFRRRPHDGDVSSSASGDLLARRVFMLLLRLCVHAASLALRPL